MKPADRQVAGRGHEPEAPRQVVIGLTGPIGCGKSTVARWLADRGAWVVDADVLSRAATDPGAPTLPAIRERFGEAVFAADATLDRGALAAVVFSDPAALADLESIVHPSVHVRILAELEAARASAAPIIVIEAIKLIEAGLDSECDEVWIVECDPQSQRARLTGRGVPAEDAERRISSQGVDLPARLAERLAVGERVMPVRRLATDGPEPDVRRQVDTLAERALARRA
jgi:dephospho-CoA kinase